VASKRAVIEAVGPSVLMLVIVLAFVFGNAPASIPHDAGTYWEQRLSFVRDHRFSFSHYTYCSRGYAFSFMLYILESFSTMIGCDSYTLFRLASAIAATLLTTVLAPLAAKRLFGVVPRPSHVVLFASLVIFFWNGYLAYPLTDFPALTALLLACLLALSRHGIALGGCGFLLALAANLRPVYVAPAVLLAAALMLREWRERGVVRACLGAAATIIGAIVVMLPQVLINRANAATWSPLVSTGFGAGGQNLYLRQLTWGLRIQRYETAVSTDYPEAAVRFLDREGTEILAHETGGAVQSFPAYFGLMIRHPLAMATLLGRHAFNGLDLRYDTPYLPRVFRGGVLRRVANYSVLVAGIGLAAVGLKRRRPPWRAVVMLATLLAPVLVALPTAVESRFFLPLHLGIYAVVAFFPYERLRWPSPASAMLIVAGALGAVLACWDASEDIFSTIEFGPPAAHGSNTAARR
jgi:hypothetical protein